MQRAGHVIFVALSLLACGESRALADKLMATLASVVPAGSVQQHLSDSVDVYEYKHIVHKKYDIESTSLFVRSYGTVYEVPLKTAGVVRSLVDKQIFPFRDGSIILFLLATSGGNAEVGPLYRTPFLVCISNREVAAVNIDLMYSPADPPDFKHVQNPVDTETQHSLGVSLVEIGDAQRTYYCVVDEQDGAFAFDPRSSFGTLNAATTLANLKLRDSPGLSGKVLQVLLAGQEVAVLGAEPEKYQIDGILDRWIYVSYMDEKGWVFGGYLKAYPRK